ncbi:alpha/beta hydrolase [Shouchella lonarensis]|uniref:Serine aminopeptidase S33 domain-containing protein n=1 Tax=Shouchella lonarensis TaxID=1464122 RepID=A0A1G6HK94_9BACI|nr:alpha/beta fold hydrolase [Shouchella lonarensis]SDB94680.1 hypothetical protein SAMN05421737_10438 [Shouchella lonarensis]
MPATTETPLSKKPKIGRMKKVIIGLVIFIVLAILAVVGVATYVGWNLSHPERVEIDETPADHGLKFEEIGFKSKADDISLKGWWIPAQREGQEIQSTKAVVFSHGYGQSRLQAGNQILPLAKRLAEEGYHLLLFDYRASGESEGDAVTLGQYESQDLLSAFSFAQEDKGMEDVAVIGWSMGAASALLAVAQSNTVDVVIADSPFANLRQYLSSNLSHWSDLPDIPFTPVTMQVIPRLIGADIDEVSPIDAITQAENKAVYFIHGKNDDAIPYTDSEAIHASMGGKNELWIAENDGHVETVNELADEYADKVVRFLQENF